MNKKVRNVVVGLFWGVVAAVCLMVVVASVVVGYKTVGAPLLDVRLPGLCDAVTAVGGLVVAGFVGRYARRKVVA